MTKTQTFRLRTLALSALGLTLALAGCEDEAGGEAAGGEKPSGGDKTLSGKVHDPFGQPIAGARVAGGEKGQTVETGADGAFAYGYSGLRPEQLVISKPGYTKKKLTMFSKLDKRPVILTPVPEAPGVYRYGEKQLDKIEMAELKPGNHPVNFSIADEDYQQLPAGELKLLLVGDTELSDLRTVPPGDPVGFGGGGLTLHPVEHQLEVTGGGQVTTQKYNVPKGEKWVLTHLVPHEEFKQAKVPENGRAFLFESK
jgi:hypothetical protein